MGLESATYVKDLVSANPLATDARSQGDDHLRLIKAVLQTSFPGVQQPYKIATALPTLDATHNMAAFELTGPLTVPLPALGGVPNGYALFIKAVTGTLTLDPNASELIEGATTYAVPAGAWVLLISKGTAWVVFVGSPVLSVAGKTGTVTLTNSDVGLANVENKSSATIRGEITASNVTTALTFTPLASVAAPLVNSGGSSPQISIPAATASNAGYATAAQITKLDGLTQGVAVDAGSLGVGLVVLCENTSAPTPFTTGSSTAGSNLRVVSFDSTGTLVVGTSPSGTWRNVNGVNVNRGNVGFFQRIS